MARLNTNRPRTHEGAPAVEDLTPIEQLRRATMACMLWEDTFYESGVEIGERIRLLVGQTDDADVFRIASNARHVANIRHAPLLLAASLAMRRSKKVAALLENIIVRGDELGEFLAIYAKLAGKTEHQLHTKLPAQVKKGLAWAMRNFDEYQLTKYSGEKLPIHPRDVLRLCHPKPLDDAQAQLWKDVIAGTRKPADTWEVSLSSGQDKRATFTRLIETEKLGYLALLRNLRKMLEVGVDDGLIEKAILARKGARRVLPFRYIAAARAAPSFGDALGAALMAAIAETPKLVGKTVVLVDVSGSMVGSKVSAKSELDRLDAAATLAVLAPCVEREIWTFSDVALRLDEPSANPLAAIGQVRDHQMHSGTWLGRAVTQVLTEAKPGRLIVISDEQSHDPIPAAPAGVAAWMINVAPNRNGVAYRDGWQHIDGFSENVLRYIASYETAFLDEIPEQGEAFFKRAKLKRPAGAEAG